MKQRQKEMIATLVKEGRIAKGYTQKELSELSHISVRSIQRIENGEILPRSYTLKTLADILGKSFEDFAIPGSDPVDTMGSEKKEARPYRLLLTQTQRIILSVGITLVIILCSWAFIAQSSRFPETNFELLLFITVVTLFITGLLALLWRKR